MISLWKAYHAKVVHLSALFLTLLFSLVSLVSCNQSEPLYTSINLGIPAAALQSPVKGNLPDSTELHIGITFKIDPRLQGLGLDRKSTRLNSSHSQISYAVFC